MDSAMKFNLTMDSLLRQGMVINEDFDTGVDPKRMEIDENLAYIKLLGQFSLNDWIINSLYRKLTETGNEIVESIFDDSLDPLVDSLLAKVHEDYKLGPQKILYLIGEQEIISMDDYILNVARELRFVQPIFRGGEHHYLEEELLGAMNLEVLPQVFRFPESALGAFYVIGKGVESGQLEVNPKESSGLRISDSGCTLKYVLEQ
jgi:hypothetical protein